LTGKNDPASGEVRRFSIRNIFGSNTKTDPEPEEPRKPPIERHGFTGWRIFGVPLSDGDTRYLIELLREVFFAQAKDDPREAVRLLLERNEHIVSRCGLLVHFSAILIALTLFIASNPLLLGEAWEQKAFYTALGVWVASTVRLLWVLRHGLPSPFGLGTDEDFMFTAELFVKRMRAYNIALLLTISCFLIVVGLLIPVHWSYADLLFGAAGKH
jgi:hypothetical protein